MGTDVHPYVEVKTEDGWKRAYITLPRDRNYVSFAILANVRNGFGFAGVPTHEAIIPISAAKGLPLDSKLKDSLEDCDYNDPAYVWLGNHSFSYLTLTELKSYDLEQSLRECGVVSGADRELVKAGKPPNNWCGDKHPMTSDDERMEWERPLRDSAYLLVKWIEQLEEFAKYRYASDDIRVVFGFDS